MSGSSTDDLPAFVLAPGDDPHAVFRHLRAKAPLARGPFGMILALRYRHLDVVIGDATRQIETETKLLQGISSGPIFDIMASGMLFSNGDVHRRRRTPVVRALAFKLMEAMRPRAVGVTTELMTPFIGQGPMDFAGEIAAQIPARLIADVLGIPAEDLPVFMAWISDAAEALGFIDLSRRGQIETSLEAFDAYVGRLIDDRRRAPRDDFLSSYAEATARAGDLSPAEIRAQIIALILAGADTTRGSLTVILAHLLGARDQWRAFCREPEQLKRGVVEEGLRFEPIVSAIPRIALRELEIDGYRIAAGAVVAASLLSMLRDPEMYADPDMFNIFRSDHPKWHPVFGAGPHRCVGEALARVEMEEALATLARLCPDTEIVGDMPVLTPVAIRQVSQLMVELK